MPYKITKPHKIAIPIIIIGLILLAVAIFFTGKHFGYKAAPAPLPPQDNVVNWATSAIYLAGFEYDPKQNIFITRQDALQRLGGYNALYDDVSTLIYMVIDIEPITFVYKGDTWMIELWKGQYYAATGCEIGVYKAVKDSPGRFYCVTDEDMLDMSFDLKVVADGSTLFSRTGIHWWLTGFKPGSFYKPEQLSMENISITLKDNEMAQAFYNAMSKQFNNPQEYKYSISNKTVKFRWQVPAFPQPNQKVDKSEYYAFNSLLATNMQIIMKGNFSPTAINNKVLEVINFLETDDHVDDFINWFIKTGSASSNAKSKIDAYVKTWDAAHGNKNMTEIITFLDSIKGRFNLLDVQITAFLKLYCYFKPKSPICLFFK